MALPSYDVRRVLVNVKIAGHTGDVTAAATRPYHHGNLRSALMQAALEEIQSRGPARLSLREIARRAGVSHAAPAHHFRDKAGVFTAIATEGFELLAAETSRFAGEPGGLLSGGLAYIRFAVDHRAHFEVMWRPELYHQDDPALATARDRSFDIFYTTVGADTGATSADELREAAVAAWSVVHGFATLWLYGNLPTELGDDPIAAALAGARGLVAVGRVTSQQLGL